jgi:hypothetical protein
MWRYINAAIFAKPRLGPLGHVPVNALALVAFGILGIVQPAFWLIGAGLVTLVVFGLATSARFRAVVDEQELLAGADRTGQRRQELVASLDAEARQRLADLQVRGVRMMDVYRSNGADSIVAQSSRDALDRLEWIYLKLLIARKSLRSDETAQAERQVRGEMEQIDRELKSDRLSPSVRESRLATRELLLKRLENAEHRRQSLAEIESDLQRIEAQVDLAYDDATLRGKPAAIGTNIQLASQMLDTSLFGASSAEIAELDESMGIPPAITPPPLRETER